ncbi:MAG: radical SAM protein [Spirochaetaceae bacterium]|jgi:hypothetical protein|nr:radical SAM protein [Spirochaetaceae bacterium]
MYLAPFNIQSVFSFHLAKRNGIVIDAFFDDDAGKQGKSYGGIPILSAAHESCDKTRSIMICSIKNKDMLHRQFCELGWTRFKDCFVFWDMDKSYKALDDIKEYELKNNFPDIYENYKKGDYEIRKTHLPEEARIPNAFILGSLNMHITTRCNLKCKNCSALIQYNKSPRHFSPQKLQESLDNLMRITDFIGVFSVSGGEPLLRRDILSIIKFILRHKEKIGVIQIITNGCIIPNKNIIELAKKHNILFAISEYGELNLKPFLKLEEFLVMHKLKYFHYTFPCGWLDIGRIAGSAHKDKETESIYNNCNLNALTMMENVLCKCSFIAAANDLRAVPFNKNNIVDLANKKLSRQEAESYINSTNPYPACSYCSGNGTCNNVHIPAAEQIESAIEYKEFIYP